MTTQTPVSAEIEKWLGIRFRFFTIFWLRVRIWVRKKSRESCRSRLRHSRSMATSATEVATVQEPEWRSGLQPES